jgi:hypothetical protein
MQYKKIITGGCGFSDIIVPYVWPNQLENYIKRTSSDITFDHRGLTSQGQKLIQKKIINAICSSLDQGYKPNQICVFVMWSDPTTKTFYIKNKELIDKLIDNWKNSTQSWHLQFGDLENKAQEKNIIYSLATDINSVQYNKNGGWFITSPYINDNINLITELHQMGSENKETMTAFDAHDSLENMILLQSFCKEKGIKLYQQFALDSLIQSFTLFKKYDIVGYLYSQLDFGTFISPNNSMVGYLKDNTECFRENQTLNGLGHRKWITEVMLPHLVDDSFFE